MAPSIGQPVIFTLPETGVDSAAIITKVHDAEKGVVNLKVFPDHGSISDRADVAHGIGSGEWREIVDEKGKPRI